MNPAKIFSRETALAVKTEIHTKRYDIIWCYQFCFERGRGAWRGAGGLSQRKFDLRQYTAPKRYHISAVEMRKEERAFDLPRYCWYHVELAFSCGV